MLVVLIWMETVCKDYQQTTKDVTGRNNDKYLNFVSKPKTAREKYSKFEIINLNSNALDFVTRRLIG